LINFETYCQYPWYSTAAGGLGWTEAQVGDLFIELARKTKQNVPNPNVTYLTWFHPQFVPQVVNRQSDFVWANTPSPWGPKVANWHNTGV
jgi:hypothetical protein